MHAERLDPVGKCGRRMRPLLGTFVEIGFEPTPGARRAVDAAFCAIEQVQRRLSFHDPNSELSRLNRCHGRFVSLSPLALRVLNLARAMTLASDGMFNCTLGGLLVHRRILPDHGEGDPLDSGTAADIEIRGQAVRLIREVRVTLDGIAKGYAVDLAIRALRCGGVRLGWVNAGGDLRAFGALTLPVQRREADGSLRALGRLRDAAIATSVVRPRAGCRFPGRLLHVNGERPALGAFSVLARYAWRADALTKVAALAPVSSRRYLVTRLGGHLIEPEPDSPVVLERNTALRSRR